MSLLSREELRIAIGPQRIDLVRLRRGWRKPAMLARQSIALEPAGGEPAWRAAIDALGPAIAGARGRSACARVVLSDHFVRYLLVAWRADLRDESEIGALARIRFREVYGAAADRWEIRLAAARFGESRFACAIDRDMLHGLLGALSKERLRLACVRPAFVSAYERWRRTAGAADCWFAVCAAGRICLCRIENGVWRSVRSQKAAGGLAQELQLALERESLNLCIDPAGQAVHVFAPEHPRIAADSVRGMRVSVYEPDPGVEPRYAMALA